MSHSVTLQVINLAPTFAACTACSGEQLQQITRVLTKRQLLNTLQHQPQLLIKTTVMRVCQQNTVEYVLVVWTISMWQR